jgi:two-component system sensor histidine kinase CpxA
MKTLFFRIFLWFWVVMVVVIAFLVVSSPYFTRSRPRIEEWQRNVEGYLQRMVDDAVAALGQTDPGPRPRFRRGGPDRHTRIFMFDYHGNELQQQPVDPDVKTLALRAAKSGRQEQERTGTLHLLARPATDSAGEPRVVVAAARRPPRLIDLLDARIVLPRLLVMAVVVGALSFWLARHLTSPLTALRQATHRLTRGDLAARVGAPINRRRDEVGGLARDFDAMAERLQALIGAQQRLLRDVSHELRSPLARQAVALELARQQAGDQARQWFDRIEREGERLEALIGQLLALTRLETGAVDPPQETIDLAALVADVVADAELEARAQGKGVRLDACHECTLSEANPNLLRSALDNVVRNAIRHTADAGEVEVNLVIAANSTGRIARISVRDHGEGVPEDAISHLFEPFFRVDEARDRELGGTGLGLTIAARAIHLHSGTIRAENAAGGGLLVELTLPA